MAGPQRDRIAPTDDWRQRERLVRTPGQRTYALIRPVVRFGQPSVERAVATNTAARTVYRLSLYLGAVAHCHAGAAGRLSCGPARP